MSRLIDAGLLLNNLSGRLESMKDYDAVRDAVNNTPTAYDVDKVVQELKNESEFYNQCNYDLGQDFVPLYNAIEIVKGGRTE